MSEAKKCNCGNMMHSIKSMEHMDNQNDCNINMGSKNMSSQYMGDKKEAKKEDKKEDKTKDNMSEIMCMKKCKEPLLIGDKMPKMKVKTTMGDRTLPDDYLGKWLILFSHPGDFTPVCTTEFVSFSKNCKNFKQLDTELLGLSVDQMQPHMEWVQWIEKKLCVPIEFPIIADPMGVVAEELGMMNSKKSSKTVRSVFMIDPEGTIRLMLHYPQEVGRNMEEIIRALAALQVADKHHVVMPANWPNNELIGDQVILPPPNNMKDIDKNKDKYACFDWWFCYKELE